MYYESDKRAEQMKMRIDNEKMLISVTTRRLVSSEEYYSWCEEQASLYADFSYPMMPNDYIAGNNTIAINLEKPLGGLLFSFIKADFNTPEGFNSYTKVWGFLGLMNVNEKNAPPSVDKQVYSSQEAEELFDSFYNSVHTELVEAQIDFKKVVDFCINADNKPYLEGLLPLQRYYAGTHKNVIPSLDKYSTPHLTFYSLSRPIVPYDDIVTYMEQFGTIEEFCNAIKPENFIAEESFYSQDIRSFAYIEFFNLIKNFTIKKCSNCNEYFVPKTKISEIYCEDCRDIGYINKVKKDKFLTAYSTAYKTKHAQKQRKRHCSEETKEKYQLALDSWREEAKSKLSLVEEGKISEKEFQDFLKSDLEV